MAAGLPGVHLNAVVWGQPILPGERTPTDAVKLVRDLGFDSVTSYVWIHHVPLPRLQTDYNEVRDNYFAYWLQAERRFGVPYYPNVTMGWDSSPLPTKTMSSAISAIRSPTPLAETRPTGSGKRWK